MDLITMFRDEQENRWCASFINTSIKPDKETPLNYYRYVEDGWRGLKFRFFRLYEVWYLRDNELWYSIYKWKEIHVKPNCLIAMKQMIDSMTGLEEFLLEDEI